MKQMLFSFSGWVLILLLAHDSSCQQKSQTENSLIPLAVGHTWIYRDSIFENGKLKETQMDTVKIISREMFEGTPAYHFSNGKELMLRHDTLYEMTAQRTGIKFPTPIFIATTSEADFNYLLGGDVMMKRKAVKLKQCAFGGETSYECWKVTDQCNAEMIFASGIGEVRSVTGDCSGQHNDYSTHTLVKFIPSLK